MKAYFPSSKDTVEEKVLGFHSLKSGWCFGEGRSFDLSRIATALKAHRLLKSRGFLNTDAFPGLDGEIRLTAYENPNYFEFTLETDGSWSFVQEKAGEIVIQEEGLTQTQVEGFIGLLVCGTFASSQLGSTGTQNYSAFKAWPLDRCNGADYFA